MKVDGIVYPDGFPLGLAAAISTAVREQIRVRLVKGVTDPKHPLFGHADCQTKRSSGYLRYEWRDTGSRQVKLLVLHLQKRSPKGVVVPIGMLLGIMSADHSKQTAGKWLWRHPRLQVPKLELALDIHQGLPRYRVRRYLPGKGWDTVYTVTGRHWNLKARALHRMRWCRFAVAGY